MILFNLYTMKLEVVVMMLSFDVGGTFIKWAYVDAYNIIEKGKIPTPQDSFESFLNAIEPLVKKFKVEGLAFSLPGTMNKEKTQIFIGGALSYNNFREFPKEVSNYFKLPVTMDNDANCAALAEIELGHLKNSENGVVIVIGTGVGCVYVHNGEILRGSHGYGGEISIFPTKDLFENSFMDCVFEGSCGLRAFLYKAGIVLNISNLTGEMFIKLVEQGNEVACKLLEEYMKQFGNMVFRLQVVYDPDCMVIGGGISQNKVFMEWFVKYAQEAFSKCPVPVEFAKIVPSTFYNDANIIGALVSYHRQREV